MSCEQAPSFLGAYVLGALDPAGRRAADEHLARCADCRAELAEFAGLTAQLDRIGPEDIRLEPVTPSPGLYDRVEAAARLQRRRPVLLAASAAAVLIVAGGATWAAVRGADEVRSATAGSMSMSVAADGRNDGTALDVTVSGLPAGENCRLVVVDEQGGRHAAGEWTAYGGDASYAVWTDVDPGAVADVVLLGTSGDELISVDFRD
jgi:anti-sigma factor RsiW